MFESIAKATIRATVIADDEVFMSFVSPLSTLEVANLCSVRWGMPNGWCLNALIGIGLHALRELGLEDDPVPWIERRLAEMKAEVDASR